MRHSITLGSALTMALLVTSSAIADDLKSGPQKGQGFGPFNPLNVTGSDSGKKRCLV